MIPVNWSDETTAEAPCAGRELRGGRRRDLADQGLVVRNWEDRKPNFELIVGQSVPEDRDARYIGLAHGYDSKPKRRLFDVLQSQGLQANQDVTFLTDGGEEARALTEFITPASEHVLDWFRAT